MFRDGSSDVSDTVWAGNGRRSWQQIDRDLRALAKRRCVLDVEEAELLRAAVRGEVWRELGNASLYEYLEEVLGYAPRTAKDRVRVALALGTLPEVTAALASGELSWSAVREVSRIVTPTTQAEWLEEVRGKNLRQIEEAVAGRKRGDRPTDPQNPDLRRSRITFEDIDNATRARVRQVRDVLANERGGRLEDNDLLAAMCDAVLGGKPNVDGRAKHQIMTIVCKVCQQAWQEGGGRRFAIDQAAKEIAECDAQRIGSDQVPERATQDVTPMTQRFVWRRDGGRCCVPTCRSSRFLDIHHVVPRGVGGSHEPDNLTLLCGGHHRALHEGKLTITGKAPALTVTWVRAHVGPEPASETFAFVAMKSDARRALVTAGYTRQEASAAVESAATHVGTDVTLEELLREAFRRCLKPN